MIVQFDIPGMDTTLPAPVVEALYIEKSKLANGYDCEVQIMGVIVGNLRIASINVPNLMLLIQEAARVAWGAKKHEAEITNYEMTVNRGGHDGRH